MANEFFFTGHWKATGHSCTKIWMRGGLPLYPLYPPFKIQIFVCACLFVIFVQGAVLGGRTPPPLAKTVLFHYPTRIREPI